MKQKRRDERGEEMNREKKKGRPRKVRENEFRMAE